MKHLRELTMAIRDGLVALLLTESDIGIRSELAKQMAHSDGPSHNGDPDVRETGHLHQPLLHSLFEVIIKMCGIRGLLHENRSACAGPSGSPLGIRVHGV